MGKVKRQARKNSNHHDSSASKKSPKVNRRQHSQQQKSRGSKPVGSKLKKIEQTQARLKVPFSKHDNVLLVGEGKARNLLYKSPDE